MIVILSKFVIHTKNFLLSFRSPSRPAVYIFGRKFDGRLKFVFYIHEIIRFLHLRRPINVHRVLKPLLVISNRKRLTNDRDFERPAARGAAIKRTRD